MRMLLHGLKSLQRRPLKTVMLFIIFFIVFNLVFIGLIINNSIKESKAYIRNQMGAVVEYRLDMERFMEGFLRPRDSNLSIPSLSISVAERIAASRYVQNLFITDSANVTSEQVEPVKTQQSLGGFQRAFSDFTLTGSNLITPLDLVMGNIKLVDGSLLSEQNLDSGDRLILISRELAATNDLKTGDIISLARMGLAGMMPGMGGGREITAEEAIDYEVVGIYEAVKDDYNVNTIFTSLEVINDIQNRGETDDTNAGIVYLLDSPDHIEAFKAEAEPYLTSEYHVLYANDEEYESLTKPLNLLSFIASILIWVVFIAGAVIILSIITIFVRDRKFEIGLLLSSGEGKLNILGQFIFEIIVVAVFAFGLSVGSSAAASGAVSGWIVDNQLLSESSLIAASGSSINGSNISQRMQPGGSSSVYGNVDMKSVAAEFDVSLSLAVTGDLFLISLLLMLTGSGIPMVVILSYKPRRILQDY